MRKKSKEDEQTLEELNSAHPCSQTKCQLIQNSYIKLFFFFLSKQTSLLEHSHYLRYYDNYKYKY